MTPSQSTTRSWNSCCRLSRYPALSETGEVCPHHSRLSKTHASRSRRYADPSASVADLPVHVIAVELAQRHRKVGVDPAAPGLGVDLHVRVGGQRDRHSA